MPELREGEEVVIDGVGYKYDSFYRRLESDDDHNGVTFACPVCNATHFRIRTKDYDATAYCKCGHKMIVTP